MSLKDKLLSIGGDDVLIPTFEYHEDEIVERGETWSRNDTEVILELGEDNECHKNTSELWYLNKDELEVYIVSGYALIDDDDSTWVQHSWLLLKESNRDVIIETTMERDIYYGYILNKIESEEFLAFNYQ